MVEDSCYICGRNQKDLVPFFGDKIKVIEDELKPFADIDKKVKNYEKKLKEFLKKSKDKSIWDLTIYLDIDSTASHMVSNDAKIHGLLPIIKQFRLAESAQIIREGKNTGSRRLYTPTNLWDLRKEFKKLLSADHPRGKEYLVSLGLITEGDDDRNFNNNYLQEERYSAYANLLNLKKKMELKQIELEFDHFLHDVRNRQSIGFNTKITKLIGDDDWPDLYSDEKHKEILEKLGHFTSDIHNEKFVSESNIKVNICPICQSILPHGQETYEDDDPYDDDDRGRDYEGPEVVEYFDDANE